MSILKKNPIIKWCLRYIYFIRFIKTKPWDDSEAQSNIQKDQKSPDMLGGKYRNEMRRWRWIYTVDKGGKKRTVDDEDQFRVKNREEEKLKGAVLLWDLFAVTKFEKIQNFPLP